MSDLSLSCAPKRTSADQSELMGSRPGWVRRCGAPPRGAAPRPGHEERGLAAEWRFARRAALRMSGAKAIPVNIVARTRRFVVLSQADLGRPVLVAKIFRFSRPPNHL